MASKTARSSDRDGHRSIPSGIVQTEQRATTANGQEGRGRGSGGGGGAGGRVIDGRGRSCGGARRDVGGELTTPATCVDSNVDLKTTCAKICTILKEDIKVNFLALDFDLTIVDIHTSGRWPGTPEQLAQRIRPFFQTLIPAAVAHGMYLGVVTFSPQVSMISRVLKVAFPDVASQIPIRGDDFTWDYDGRGATDGKQSHMASAVEELTRTHAASITRASTLLIDDDLNNKFSLVRKAVGVTELAFDKLLELLDWNQYMDRGYVVSIALSEGVRSIWCNPKDPDSMIEEILSLSRVFPVDP